jgi:hypothetical protein
MKQWFGLLIGLSLLSPAGAQETAIITVSMTQIAVTGGSTFKNGTQNESYGPVGATIAMSALAVGTYPAGKYAYTFSVDGMGLGSPAQPPENGFPGTISWAPPRPGSYFFNVVATDGAHSATSLPIRYFAVGTMITSPVTNTIVPNGSSVAIQAVAMAQPLKTGTNAFIQRIEFYADGVKIGEDATAPYSTVYTPNPALPSPHVVEARAFDNNGNQVSANGAAVVSLTSVPPIGTPPVVNITSPANGSTLAIPAGGPAIPVTVSAGSANGLITKVELYIEGGLFGTATTFPYRFQWTPTVVGDYRLVALAYDDKNNVVASTTSNVAGTSPLPTLVKIAAPPTSSLVAPIADSILGVGSAVVLTASASDSNVIGGGITKVQFFADGVLVGEAASPTSGNRYSVSWTPSKVGGAAITALAINNFGISTLSPQISVSVTEQGGGGAGPKVGAPPNVSVSSPRSGAQFAVNREVSISVSATDTDGNIAAVEFFQNGHSLGTVTTYPYVKKWTPGSLGNYALTARAVDGDGNTTTSSVVKIAVTSGVGERSYASFTGASDAVRFALHVSGQQATFIGYTSGAASKVYFYRGIALDSAGGFSHTDSSGKVVLAGSAGDTGVTITRLDGAATVLIGTLTTSSSSVVAPGLYSGNISGSLASQVTAIIGEDGSVALYVADGSNRAAGSGAVSATGEIISVTMSSGGVLKGRIDPNSSFFSGTLAGTPGGALLAGLSSGLTFSDGVLKNLSSRARLGTGNATLTAGFIVSGSTAKQVLIRAVGPSLRDYGVAAPAADPSLTIFRMQNSGAAAVQTNNDWVDSPALAATSVAVGAFPLTSGSKDAVVLANLAPGTYTAQVAIASGAAGVGLIEIYDGDVVAPYSSQKVINLSTSALVGPGQDELSAGFMVGGSTPKKVLIRASGPGLGAVSSALAGAVLLDPKLRLLRVNADGSTTDIRENDSWEVGNDAALLAAAAAQSGAFPFSAGSKDAAILITIPPGTYIAIVSGTGTATGLALVEVYEVP